jgi:hypothetical protein
MPKLDVDYRHFLQHTERIRQLLANVSPLGPKYQKLIAELLLLRLFSLLETTIAAVTTKALCGAHYVDSTTPMLVVNSRNASEALTNMLNVGWNKPRLFLKWTKASEITKNVRYLMDPADSLVSTVQRHGALLEEMRCVRNHVAHQTSGTRAKFKPIVSKYYGAYVNAVTPGVLLLSTRQRPILIEHYVGATRIMVKEIVRA